MRVNMKIFRARGPKLYNLKQNACLRLEPKCPLHVFVLDASTDCALGVVFRTWNLSISATHSLFRILLFILFYFQNMRINRSFKKNVNDCVTYSIGEFSYTWILGKLNGCRNIINQFLIKAFICFHGWSVCSIESQIPRFPWSDDFYRFTWKKVICQLSIYVCMHQWISEWIFFLSIPKTLKIDDHNSGLNWHIISH